MTPSGRSTTSSSGSRCCRSECSTTSTATSPARDRRSARRDRGRKRRVRPSPRRRGRTTGATATMRRYLTRMSTRPTPSACSPAWGWRNSGRTHAGVGGRTTTTSDPPGRRTARRLRRRCWKGSPAIRPELDRRGELVRPMAGGPDRAGRTRGHGTGGRRVRDGTGGRTMSATGAPGSGPIGGVGACHRSRAAGPRRSAHTHPIRQPRGPPHRRNGRRGPRAGRGIAGRTVPAELPADRVAPVAHQPERADLVRDRLSSIGRADAAAGRLAAVLDAARDFDAGTPTAAGYGRPPNWPSGWHRPQGRRCRSTAGCCCRRRRSPAGGARGRARRRPAPADEPHAARTGHLAVYRRRFESRYGSRGEVGVLELLDPITGLGPPSAPEAGRLDPGRSAERAATLLSLATSALRDQATCVELDANLLRRLESADQAAVSFPPSAS